MATITRKKLGERIKELREDFNYSQDELAKKIKVSRPAISQIESGTRDINSTELANIAKVFDVSMDTLLEIYDEEEKPKQRSSGDLQIRATSKNLDKFKQVLLYVLGKVGSKPNIGETVLHKILYFIDFDYFEKFEENLMGATYIKNRHGPTSVELKDIFADMQKKGEIEAVKSQYFKYEQKKYLPLKRPNLDKFSARDIEHIDEVLARLADKNAKEIENYSHEDIPWKTAEEGQSLSYESVFYRDERYSVRNYDDKL